MKKRLLWMIPMLVFAVVMFTTTAVSFADTEESKLDGLGFAYSYTDEEAESEEDTLKEVVVEGDAITLDVADTNKFPEQLYLNGAPEGVVFQELTWKSDNELIQYFNYNTEKGQMEISGSDTGMYPGQADLTVGKGIGEVTLTVTGKAVKYNDMMVQEWEEDFTRTLKVTIKDDNEYAVYVLGSDPETYDLVVTKVAGKGASTQPLSYDVSGEAYPYDFCYVCYESKVPDVETFEKAWMDDMQDVYEIPSDVTWKSSTPKAVFPLYPKEGSSDGYMILGFPGESGTATLTADVNGKEYSFDISVKYDNPEYYQFGGYSFFYDCKSTGDSITLYWDKWIYDDVKIKFGTSPETAVEIDPSEFGYDDDSDCYTYTATGLQSGTTYYAYMDGIISIDGEEYHSYSNWDEFSTLPGKVTLKSAKAKKGQVTFQWKKTTCAGYQIQVATNKKFTKGKKSFNVNGGNKQKYVAKKLKKGKKYFVRIRPYVMNYGEKVYGSWSNVKNVKVK